MLRNSLLPGVKMFQEFLNNSFENALSSHKKLLIIDTSGADFLPKEIT